ncbi:MAG TPA: VOC family protein [Xanthobacteraceae bacterium]|nr:VOC family protein [Xanthobacteraceae bacterium]
MQTNPYLFFAGQCEAAFKFYEKVLGGKTEMMLTHAETPAAEQTPAEWQKKIIHAHMRIGNMLLMASDAPPGHQDDMKGFSLNLSYDTKAEAERVFNALAEKGEIRMPFQETFFATGFGMLADQFGAPWMVICEKKPA